MHVRHLCVGRKATGSPSEGLVFTRDENSGGKERREERENSSLHGPMDFSQTGTRANSCRLFKLAVGGREEDEAR